MEIILGKLEGLRGSYGVRIQARSQTFEKGGAKFQKFMNSIYPEVDIVTKIAHSLPILQF